MTKKKTSDANIEKNRKVYFFVGLILALCVTLIALEWSSNTKSIIYAANASELELEQVSGIDIVVIPEPPKPKKSNYEATNKEEKITKEQPTEEKKAKENTSRFVNLSKNEIDISQFPEDIVYIDTADLPFIDDNAGSLTKKVTDIDKRPYFASCCENGYTPLCFDCTEDAIIKFINDRIEGTQCVKDQGGIELIWTKVTINEVGNVAEVSIENQDEVCPESAEQIINAFLQLPQMIPGEYAGMTIRVSYYIPIKIRFMKS